MKTVIPFCSLLMIFMLWNCASDHSSEEKTSVKIEIDGEEKELSINIENEDDLFDALHNAIDKVEEELDEAGNKLDKKNRVTAVDYESLKAELPMMISGMLRTKAEGERSGIGKFKVSSARAEYETDDRHLTLIITDTGNIPFAKKGYELLSKADVEHDSDDEYFRQTTIDGFPAYEEYNRKSENGSIMLVVNERFMVKVEGRNVSEKQLKRAIEKVDLKKLARL